MAYLKEWRHGAGDASGDADFVVEGDLFTVPLPTLDHCQMVEAMLWTAFRQGKRHAFNIVKSKIIASFDDADIKYNLSMDK